MLSRFSFRSEAFDKSTGDENLDILLKETDEIIKELEVALKPNKDFFKLLRRRSSKKDECKDPASVYKTLSPQIQENEMALRRKISEAIEKKQAFLDQALYLKERIDSCIIFNGNKIRNLDTVISEIQDTIERICTQIKLDTQSLSFNTEIIKQYTKEKAKVARRKSAFSVWSFMGIGSTFNSDLAADAENSFFVGRLKRFEELEKSLKEYIPVLSEVRATHSSNFSLSILARKVCY